MTSIGETLRRERLRRNLDLGQIASETKISAKLLEAIESEQFDKLPGGVFTRSFVRQYAQVLGLDGDEIVSELDRVLDPPAPAFDSTHSRPDVPPTEIHLPKVEEWQQVGDRRQWSASLPAAAMVVAVMLVCSLVYAWWQRRPLHPAPAPEYTHAVSQHSAPQTTPPAPAQSAAPAPVQAETAPQTPAPVTPVAQQVPAPATPPAAPPKAPPPQAPPNPNATVHVQLIAEEPTWVLVRTDGKYLFSGTLQPNDTRMVDAVGTVLVRLGNAAGVNITLNGKPLGPIGPKGQVRTVQLSASGFQVVPAAPAQPKAPPPTDPLD